MPTESQQIARINAQLGAAVRGVVAGIAEDVLDDLAQTTPMATGASASSWRASATPNGPNVRRSRGAVAQSQTAQVASKAKIPAIVAAQGKVFVGSAQVGIEALNNGSSFREPAAFVQRGIRKAVLAARVRPLALKL